jgi:hypothetical protein
MSSSDEKVRIGYMDWTYRVDIKKATIYKIVALILIPTFYLSALSSERVHELNMMSIIITTA